MTPYDFDEILGLIQDDIIKTNTNMLQQYDYWLRVTLNCSANSFLFLAFSQKFFINYKADIS